MEEPMDVFDYNSKLVESLTAHGEIVNASYVFRSLPSNYERVMYVTKLLKTHKIKPDVALLIPKNDQQSIDSRTVGNHLFKEKKFYEALKNYNQSLCFAILGSQNQSICYANRSAVYYHLEMFEECLENIKLSKAAGAKDDLLIKINKREISCLEMMDNKNSQNTDNLEVKLSYPEHPSVPYIVNCLDLKNDVKSGRSVVTNKDLKPGDVIAIEEPYCVNVSAYAKYERCYYCLSENKLSLISCPNCTSAMFCNKECYQLAHDKYHKYDCPILNGLYQLFTKIHVIGLKVVLTAIHDFTTIENLNNFINETVTIENQPNAFTFDYKNEKKRKEIYSLVHSLETNQAKRTVADLFQRATIIAFLLIYLKGNNETKLLFAKGESCEMIFTELFYHHIMTSATNMHTLDQVSKDDNDINRSSGSGAYPFASLINHSCIPNIKRMFNGTKLIIIVHRPIKKGDDLMDNYGYHHCLHDKEKRQHSLMLQYRFRCECIACIENYPLLFNLKNSPNIPSIITEIDHNTILNFDKKFSMDKLPIYCKYICDYDKYYPCWQLSETLESLHMCCFILFTQIPMRFTIK